LLPLFSPKISLQVTTLVASGHTAGRGFGSVHSCNISWQVVNFGFVFIRNCSLTSRVKIGFPAKKEKIEQNARLLIYG
jgi:hypothetical protein